MVYDCSKIQTDIYRTLVTANDQSSIWDFVARISNFLSDIETFGLDSHFVRPADREFLKANDKYPTDIWHGNLRRCMLCCFVVAYSKRIYHCSGLVEKPKDKKK